MSITYKSFTIEAVGAYHTINDVADVFGIDNLGLWLQLGASDTSQTMSARAQKIISFTEAFVDSWFRRSRYLTPFNPAPLEIVEICCYISGSKMYEPRTTDDYGAEGANPLKTFVMAKRKAALDTIRQIVAGKMVIDAALDPGIVEAPALVRADYMYMRPVNSNELSLDELANITLNSDGGYNANFSDQ